MSRAYLDTTVLTDALLKPHTRGAEARAAIRGFDQSLLPVYAIKEFKAGPLSHFAWLHNKCVVEKSYARVMAGVHAMSRTPRRYRTSTALEALTEFLEQMRDVTPRSLEEQYGADAKFDNIMCDRLRFSLRVEVDLAWEERRSVASETVDELECYCETAPRLDEHGLFDLTPNQCEPKRECSLADEYRKQPDVLRAMHEALAGSEKLEHVRRAKVLKQLYRTPRRELEPEECRRLGDAVFVFFAPQDATILTTNKGDHEILANAVGKSVATPPEIIESQKS